MDRPANGVIEPCIVILCRTERESEMIGPLRRLYDGLIALAAQLKFRAWRHSEGLVGKQRQERVCHTRQ